MLVAVAAPGEGPSNAAAGEAIAIAIASAVASTTRRISMPGEPSSVTSGPIGVLSRDYWDRLSIDR